MRVWQCYITKERMLFKIVAGKDIFELNPELKLIPEFADLLPMQMTTVALFADYESPFRTKPERERREIAAKAGGYPLESDGKRLNKNAREFVDGKRVTLEAAIEKYREIQYDETRAILGAYDKQIQEILELMVMDKKDLFEKDPKLAMDLAEKAGKLSKLLPEIKESKKKIQELMNMKDNEPELGNHVIVSDLPEDNQGLSLVDSIDFDKMRAK